jgi:hypothetical protein
MADVVLEDPTIAYLAEYLETLQWSTGKPEPDSSETNYVEGEI